MKTLSLFNAVLSKPVGKTTNHVDLESGLVITANAAWATSNIVAYYKNQKLSGNELNKTFHKSFAKVRSSSRFELLVEQIKHYCSTYGTDFQGEIYIPDEVLEIPDTKITFRVIQGLSRDEMINKCFSMLNGMALAEDTINDILSVLVDELCYKFTGKEKIRNREAVVKIADIYGVLPEDTTELFRYCVYKATSESLLIKNVKAIQAIKSSNFDPSALFNQHGLEKLASIFNRFKPLFLAFKSSCPSTINAISRLSKSRHKPLVSNPLNEVTHRALSDDERHWLDSATPFAIFKALTALHNRIQGQTSFCYRIRNGKSWVRENSSANTKLLAANFSKLMNYAKGRWSLSGRNIYIPEGINYAVPTSEKMYVGNIPTGTKFCGEKLAIGIYWENRWGARDLDLSAIDIGGSKVGWNSRYYGKDITFSGDVTSAPNGAVEYLHFMNVSTPKIISNCVFSGEDTSGYKIIVGAGDEVSKPYMMDPNKVMAEVKTEAVQKQMILGIILPEKIGQSFVLLNFGMGQARVSSKANGLQALYEQYETPFSFNDLVKFLGANLVDSPENALDLSINELGKGTFVDLFS